MGYVAAASEAWRHAVFGVSIPNSIFPIPVHSEHAGDAGGVSFLADDVLCVDEVVDGAVGLCHEEDGRLRDVVDQGQQPPAAAEVERAQ